jgi:CO/xanthine dehydrogenase FAD-binding subunit
MEPFEYIEPSTLKEETQLLFDHGGNARVLAGSVHLVPKMRKGEIKMECLVNIWKISLSCWENRMCLSL